MQLLLSTCTIIAVVTLMACTKAGITSSPEHTGYADIFTLRVLAVQILAEIPQIKEVLWHFAFELLLQVLSDFICFMECVNVIMRENKEKSIHFTLSSQFDCNCCSLALKACL